MVIFRTLIIRDRAGEIIDTIELPAIEREPGKPWRDLDPEIVETTERQRQ